MTRLYNHTRYADPMLRDVLNFAARCAGVEGDVPVKVTNSLNPRPGGMAWDGWPYLKTLKGKPTTSVDKRHLKCPRGWVEVSLPRSLSRCPGVAHPALDAAEWFVDLAIHEMAHIRQYRQRQFKDPAFYGRRSGGRRIAHDKRPCEIDADNALYDVRHNRQRDRRRQDLVIALALELEAANAAKA